MKEINDIAENADTIADEEKVEVRRQGTNVTWIFRNAEHEPIEFDMSFMRADTITALLKRSVNLGQGEEMKPKLLQGLQTELYVYPDHYAIIFDKNPHLRLVRSPEQVTHLIKDLEELAA